MELSGPWITVLIWNAEPAKEPREHRPVGGGDGIVPRRPRRRERVRRPKQVDPADEVRWEIRRGINRPTLGLLVELNTEVKILRADRFDRCNKRPKRPRVTTSDCQVRVVRGIRDNRVREVGR